MARKRSRSRKIRNAHRRVRGLCKQRSREGECRDRAADGALQHGQSVPRQLRQFEVVAFVVVGFLRGHDIEIGDCELSDDGRGSGRKDSRLRWRSC